MTTATETLPAKRTKRTPAKTQPPMAGPSTALEMLTAAQDKGCDIQTIEAFAALYREERDDARRCDFDAAMSAAQAEMATVQTDAKNAQTHSKYATYAALDKALRPIYTKHGFALSFDTEDSTMESNIRVVCRVAHKGGFGRTHHIDMPADGKGAKGGDVMTKTHAAGSAVSYGMRYLLKMIFNVSVGDVDDDGNAATRPPAVINRAQVATIEGLCKQLPPDIKGKMLNYVQVAAVDAIPAQRFGEVMKSLNGHIECIAKAEQGSEQLPL